jgi:tRNA threonylcarbamoyladenosine biosynthesis protein TsaB
MYILSVDTTAKSATVCVAKSDEVFGIIPIAQLDLNSTATHSESLLPMIDKALELSSLNISDMDCFAITAGPGSFTGVRIGVSAIKGLAFALGDEVPCIPLSTLYCLALNAAGYAENAIVCPVMDARREQFYNAMFRISKGKLKRLCEDRVFTAKELTDEISEKYSNKKIILCGDGAKLFYSLLPKYTGDNTLKIELARPGDIMQNAFSVAYAAWEKYCSEDFDKNAFKGSALSPIYLRLSQAERERNEKLKNQGETK